MTNSPFYYVKYGVFFLRRNVVDLDFLYRMYLEYDQYNCVTVIRDLFKKNEYSRYSILNKYPNLTPI